MNVCHGPPRLRSHRRPSISCMPFLHRVPFRSRRRRPTCGGTLIRAYRARAGVLAPARFARLIAHACARAREGSGAGALLPSASPALFASARVEATSGRRFIPPHLGMGVHDVKPKLRNISDKLNKLQSRSPARRCRPRSASTPKASPAPPPEASFSTREGPAARLSVADPGPESPARRYQRRLASWPRYRLQGEGHAVRHSPAGEGERGQAGEVGEGEQLRLAGGRLA